MGYLVESGFDALINFPSQFSRFTFWSVPCL